jgi:hypothetical protein
MWIKFNYHYTVDGRPATQKFAIEVADTTKALIVGNTLSNVDKITDAKVMLEMPTDMYTIYLNEKAETTRRSDHLVTHASLQSFIWTLKAGIDLGRA